MLPARGRPGYHDMLAGFEPGKNFAALGQGASKLHDMAADCPVVVDIDLIELADPAHGLAEERPERLLRPGE